MRKWINYLKKNSIFIILFIFFFGLSRCGLIFENHSISPEKPTYLKAGDLIIFESENNIDSFYVEYSKVYQPGENENEDEEYLARMNQVDCTDSCYSFGVTIIPGEYWAGCWGFEYSGYQIREYYSGHTITVGSYKLEDLYGSYNISTDSISGKEISSLLYSKKYGFVEYKLTNGEVFTITEGCITMLKARE